MNQKIVKSINFKLTKITEGEEGSEPGFFYVDEFDRIYYGNSKDPNFCLEGEHELIQLLWLNGHQVCPICDRDDE